MKKLLIKAIKAAIDASKEVLFEYQNNFDIFIKSDNTPVTTADKKSHKIIIEQLKDTNIPILSEEGEHFNESIRNKWDTFWCIDPIDGTREFIDKTDEYCICIGLVDKNTSYIGVLIAPSLNLFYFACESIGSYKYNLDIENLFDKEINLNYIIENSTKLPLSCQKKDYTFLTSKFYRKQEDEQYLNNLYKKYPKLDVIKIGSAIKFGLIAEGFAHEYTRFSSVYFWDIAAGHAIVKYANLNINFLNNKKEPNYINSNIKINNFMVTNNTDITILIDQKIENIISSDLI